MELKENVNKHRKEKWIELALGIEVLAIRADVAQSSLKKHVTSLSKENGVFVYDTRFSEIQKVDNPMKNVEQAFSQVVHLKLFVKNISVLMQVIALYGPSSIEVLGPNKKEIDLSEVQNIANNLASIVHQFAAAGVGGIVITPEKK